MRDKELISSVLGLDDKWQIQDLSVNAKQQRLDVILVPSAPRMSFFFQEKPIDCGGCGRSIPSRLLTHAAQWRHHNLGTFHTYIQAALPQDMQCERSVGCPFDKPYLGTIGQPVTHGLRRTIIGLLNEGLSSSKICRVLDLDLQTVWSIEQGNAAAEPEKEESLEDADLPDLGHPGWRAMASGDWHLKTKLLSLSLLLSRLRSQFNHADNDDLRQRKLHELRQFFLKNKALLSTEIEQLNNYK